MPIRGDYLARPTYEILHTIGDGASGVCWRAKHDVFGQDVVQKAVSMLGVPDGVANEPRLLKEARHPHLIEVWDAQWDPELTSIKAVTFVCPYYPGGSVYDAIVKGRTFGVGDAMHVVGQVLDALAYLHQEKRYLHRDVKPANILLDVEGKDACLADLGSAGQIHLETGDAANYGGTRLYLDPVAVPSGRVTVRSDLFSLGSVAVEMLGGRFPYEQINENVTDVDDRLAAGKRPLAGGHYRLPPHVPKVVRRFVASLVNPEPEKRPETAQAALRKLNSLEYVDWRVVSVDGEWSGTWPPHKHPEKRREYRVQSEPVSKGKNAGRVRLTARWRDPGKGWRNLKKLDCYADVGDERALAGFFRAVEAEAQASPA